jgi:hypothetical protein
LDLLLTNKCSEIESRSKGRKVIGALQGKQVDGTRGRRESEYGAFRVDRKSQNGCAVSILRQKGRELEDNPFSSAEGLGKLIEHNQDVRQCGVLRLLAIQHSRRQCGDPAHRKLSSEKVWTQIKVRKNGGR